MGRAIVREPQAFLMDEPLSNLDAKLRVQMRSEIAKIQHDLGTTTIYVTHDQVEAMTMGDRVAVMRKGLLQQVEAPQVLYDHPLNLFVAGFIGSPAMNLVEGALSRSDGSMFAEFGGNRLRVADEALRARPALARFDGKNVVLGLRPESMEDASLLSDAPQDRRISATVDLREALGSQIVIHFTVDAPIVLTEDTRELAHDVGAEALDELHAQAAENKSRFVAQLDPRTQVREGDTIELLVDTARFHFFDPETGLGIYDE
jgi:multiple sugar transport system ATP-binding protein